MGPLAFFIEFLTLTGLWERRKHVCPLFYTNPNAPEMGDMLGTWLLSILSGHKRYAHEHEGWTDAGQGWEGLDGTLSSLEEVRLASLFERAHHQIRAEGAVAAHDRIAASCRHAPWRSSTTDGVCTFDWRTRRRVAKRSPVARG